MISDALKARMAEMVARYPQARSAMLPCLHLAQDELGYVSDEAIVAVANAIGAKPDEVESVVTFYSMYHQHPQGKYVVKVCASVSCYLMGCDDVLAQLERQLGVKRGETSADGMFTLESVECLAACGMAPALQVNGEFVEQVTPQTVDTLVTFLKSGGDPANICNRWTQIGDGVGMTTETTIGANDGANGATNSHGVSSTKKVE